MTVVDPAHPLFGRTFRVAPGHRGPREPRSLEVELRDGILIRIPIAATDRGHCPSPAPGTRITAVALCQLVALAQQGEASCPSHPAPSGDGSPNPSADTSSAN